MSNGEADVDTDSGDFDTDTDDFDTDTDTETVLTKTEEMEEKMDKMNMLNETDKMGFDSDSDNEMIFTKIEEIKEKTDERKKNETDKMEKKEAARWPPFIRPQRRTSPQIQLKIKNHNSWVRRIRAKEYKQENEQYKKEVAARRACDRGYNTAVPYVYPDQDQDQEEEQEDNVR